MYKKSFTLLISCIMMVLFISQNLNSQTILATAEWQEHTYNIIEYPGISWDAAKINAQASDYYLATITSQDEQDFIISVLQDDTISGEYWLGGYQTDPYQEPRKACLSRRSVLDV